MTEKEKIKAYDEALEKAKKILEMTSDKSAIYTIFPELAESEDEKIRKEIALTLEYLVSTPKSALHPGAHYTVEEALAWLEKQGKQKQEWSEEDERMCQETIDWFEKKCFPYALESENPARESIKWLKTLKGRLQPQWKPSDEQMEALKAMTKYCDIATSFDAHKQMVVESLYSELKKLKEKKL